MYKKIVAGTDLSQTARIATDRAASLAARLGAELTLVHAGSDPGEELETLAKEYGADHVTVEGPPADVLIGECERIGADLLAVGSVGMSGAKRFLLGSVPNKVSHHAISDLLIVKTDPPPKSTGDYTRVLVGTDGSPTAMRAVDMASDLSQALGIRPVVVCAYEPPTEHELKAMKEGQVDALEQWKAGGVGAGVPEEFRWRIAGAAQAEDVLERAQEHAAKRGIEAEVKALQGSPAEVLISTAESGDFGLIVVGSVGMSGAKRFALGNVPNRISHHAPTDVLILKTT